MDRNHVIRAADRTFWRGEGIVTRQSFPFTGKFDLGANAHGQLLVHNDDLIDPGSGVDRHYHRDAEIVTWVVEGRLDHDDSSGAAGSVHAGQVQAMSAGDGVNHRERNPRSTRTVARVIQMWLPPNAPGGTPQYRTADVEPLLVGGAVAVIASGMDGHEPAVRINNDAAALHAARVPAGGVVQFPAAPYGHLFVVAGSVTGGVGQMNSGDALRTFDAPAFEIHAVEPAEILFWEMHAQAASALRR